MLILKIDPSSKGIPLTDFTPIALNGCITCLRSLYTLTRLLAKHSGLPPDAFLP